MGDKGRDNNRIRILLLEQGLPPCVPPRRNRKQSQWRPVRAIPTAPRQARTLAC